MLKLDWRIHGGKNCQKSRDTCHWCHNLQAKEGLNNVAGGKHVNKKNAAYSESDSDSVSYILIRIKMNRGILDPNEIVSVPFIFIHNLCSKILPKPF